MSAVDRLAALRERLERDRTHSSAERDRRELEQRAHALARALPAEAPPTTELLCFTVGDQRFAVDADVVVRVLLSVRPTPVPGAPRWMTGAIGHLGRVVPVFDLAALLHDAPPYVAPAAILIEDGEEVVALGAEEILGAEAVLVRDLAVPPPTEGALMLHVRAVTPDGAAVLDAAGMLRDPRLSPFERTEEDS